jgi:hypothetical protein
MVAMPEEIGDLNIAAAALDAYYVSHAEGVTVQVVTT